MSVMFVVVPVVAGSWPLISAAVIAASAALGYSAIQNAEAGIIGLDAVYESEVSRRSVSLVMEDSDVVSDTLMRGESFQVQRDGITATFRVDGRGQCNVHVAGQVATAAALQAAGQELMDRVRQQFAYAKVMEELETRGFAVAQQEMQQNKSIRINVRRA